MGAGVLCLFLGWGTAVSPRDHAFHLREEVILRVFFVAKVGAIDGDGGKDLEDAVNEKPTAAAAFVGVDEIDHVGLLESDEVRDEIGVHILVSEGVDVAGFRVAEAFAPGLGEEVGG